MEHDVPAATDAFVTAAGEPNERMQAPDTSLAGTPVDSGISAAQVEIDTEHEMVTDAEQQLDGDASQQPVEAEDAKEKEDPTSDEDNVAAAGLQEQNDVVMAEPTASAAAQQVDDVSEEKDTVIVENEDAATITAQEADLAGASKSNDEAGKKEMPVTDIKAPPAQDSASLNEADTASNDEQHTNKNADIMSAEDDGASSPPPHDESEYDPSAPSLIVDPVPHGEDEYDPANPSPAGTPVASNAASGIASYRPANEQEEYDPDHPSMTSAAEEPAAMEVDHLSTNSNDNEQSSATPAKRKADDESRPSHVSANGDNDPKRPRHVDDSKSRSHDDHRHGRPRRGSSDSVSSSSSRHKHEEDHKGLSAAAWDRLMDFQTSGEFRVTQVSRAAFASVGAMPEFAQIAIIARFVRTPMKEIRDKNGQLMRIYREYQKENPQIAALQPADAFVADYKSDPGLFRFGYAPPQPATGMSNVQVPYQRDQVQEDTPAKNSPRPERTPTTRSESERHQKPVDEFGRAVSSDNPLAPATNGASRSTQRPAADPRLASRSRQGPASPTLQPMPRATSGARAEDPRRRDQPPQSSNAGRDPRRRALVTNQPSPRGNQPNAPQSAASNDLYERLPAPVKAVVDSMRREGRLHEPLNDNVITRLLHLPERVALQAVENFSNVDLSQVENLQGFLVGIINRVNEKAIASEKQHRPQVPSPRGQPPSSMSRGYGAPPQGSSVLGGPPQGGRLNNNNGANTAGYRGQPAPGPGPALYERPYEAPQEPRDPRRRQPAPQGPTQYGGAGRGPSPVGGHAPIGMPSFTALPMSVQNHVHSLVANHTLSSLEELGGKCYEVLGQLSEPLANQVLTRFAGANLSNVRNKSGFLIGVVKRARQEYGFN
ncbi:Heterogeneous nuclear ribonucleoprotein Q acidic domain [Phytophthora infestans]|uniref:Heterogeneous nuclear ribonucleoprotein Q acidic domain n=1 Tax=Phytophthora infestans TaxID=4787 RepID=A0A8S9VA55_PHYIN|nr:Heterogeneous nuclear ribonucleoprotein Q acidic domain [Phytophthora infestans]